MKKVFAYLDKKGSGEIDYNDFKMLDEENQHKVDIKSIVRKMQQKSTSDSVSVKSVKSLHKTGRDFNAMSVEELEKCSKMGNYTGFVKNRILKSRN